MPIASLDSQLPIVVLKKKFWKNFQFFLHNEIREFIQEEGGYIIGKFLGSTVEVYKFYHDKEADCSIGDIKLSSEAFDEAVKLANDTTNSSNKSLSVIGTWHTHPPGYGVRYSTIDVETLFVDRMVVNSFDPSNYDAPQIHMIISGHQFEEMAIYTLSLNPGPKLIKLENYLADKKQLNIPDQKSYGIAVDFKKSNFISLSHSLWNYTLQKNRLSGIWRMCDPKALNLKWEALFVENFLRNLRSRNYGAQSEKNSEDKNYTYCRLIPQKNKRKILVEKYQFKYSSRPNRIFFEPLPFILEGISYTITLESSHPEGQPIDCEYTPATMVLDLIEQVQQKAALESPPILWTLLNPEGAQHFASFTKVDEFGKTFLPDDLNISAVLDLRASSDTPVYWESTALNPDITKQLRLYRFEQMGYDLKKLAQSHVLIAGLGILGCEIANLLGTVNIGKFSLLDNGRVDWVNIYRQSLYRKQDVGTLKVQAAASYLEEMGSVVNPLAWSIPSTLITDVVSAGQIIDDLFELIKDVDVVVGALDSFSTRAVLQILCRIQQKPFLASSLDFLPGLAITQGTVTYFHLSKGRCYGCGSDIKTLVDRGACTNAPIEFPKIVGGIAAKAVVDLLVSNAEDHPMEYKIYHDYTIEKNKLGKGAKGCKLCSIAKEKDKAVFIPEIINWLLT